MNRYHTLRKIRPAIFCAGIICLSLEAGAQTPPAAPPPPVAEAPIGAQTPQASPSVSVEDQLDRARASRGVTRIGQDFALGATETAREVTVIFGNVTIDGTVGSDVVVVMGQAQVAGTALIGGDFVVVGGGATVAPGATFRRDLVVVGGGLDAPPGLTVGGEQVLVGSRTLGRRFESFLPWITRGLLWGRPIVPNLPWIWGVVAFFFLVYLILNFIFDHPIRACATTMADRPLTAFLVGLLVLLLTGPVCVLLAVSVIGIAVVPFVLCAIVIAGILGRIGTVRWIGRSVVPEGSPDNRLESMRSFAIGFALICLAYMVPVLGLVTWTMLGVFGIGGAALAFIAAYRRENPAPVPPVVPPSRPVPALSQEAPLMSHPDAPATDLGASAVPRVPAAPMQAGFPTAADVMALPHAIFGDRLAAFVLDVILVVIVQRLLDLRPRDSAIFLLLFAYKVGFLTWKGTTVGGIICQLRVVRVDGSPLRFVDALVRGFASIFSIVVLGIGFLWVLKDPERQAWHDKIAGTYVVKVPKNWPL